MHAEILATGSELLSPDRSDTNSLWLTARLDDIGIPVRRKTIVGDHGPDLQEAIAQALGRAELVICTGGLGPTQDDVTREAAAQATGCFLRSDPVIEEGLRRRFAERGLEMPSNNLRQAMVPEGARCLPNRLGTAPGILLETHGRWLALQSGDAGHVYFYDAETSQQLPQGYAGKIVRWKGINLEVQVGDDLRLVMFQKQSAHDAAGGLLGDGRQQEAGSVRSGRDEVQIGDVRLPIRRQPREA
jgi:molybdenum cofactor synthesis domain-containing protein